MGTIAHAIFVVPDVTGTYYRTWDGPTFNRNSDSGERASICFTSKWVVGAVYDIHSPRDPFRTRYRPVTGDRYDPLAYFAGAPDEVVALAQAKPLQYLLDDLRGVVQPVITAAFWSEGEMLTAIEPWQRVLDHGARVLDKELMAPAEALPEWQDNYEFTDEQMHLLESVFRRRLAAPDAVLHLTDDERRVLTAAGDDGIEASRELLAAVGIVIPESTI